MFKKNALKARLLGGEQLFGVWIETGSVINAEILAQTGFDFLLLDLEHGQGDIKECIDILRAVDSTNVPCVVRVPSNDPVFLKRILDGGVQSIMVPQVNTAQEAAAAVRVLLSASRTKGLRSTHSESIPIWRETGLHDPRQRRAIAHRPARVGRSSRSCIGDLCR
jgi:2-keto-3-deoxy-L-rhamnonate aldolase RhmA